MKVRRSVYKPLGFLFLGLAALGVVLPILQTAPFLLLAAWLFARSSEKWHSWLLASQLFGPMITNWEQRRCIACRTKMVAITTMTLLGGTSIFYVVDLLWLQLLGLVLLGIGAFVVLSINTCEQ